MSKQPKLIGSQKCRPEPISWNKFRSFVFKRAWVEYRIRLKHRDPLTLAECIKRSYSISLIVYNVTSEVK